MGSTEKGFESSWVQNIFTYGYRRKNENPLCSRLKLYLRAKYMQKKIISHDIKW